LGKLGARLESNDSPERSEGKTAGAGAAIRGQIFCSRHDYFFEGALGDMVDIVDVAPVLDLA
jgi:hypothetical protein